jgi:hypothetical protein
MTYHLAFQTGGTLGLLAGVAFFLIAAAVAYIAFRMLKRSAKMAFRVVVLVIILGIAAAGSIALWALTSGGSAPASRPARTR